MLQSEIHLAGAFLSRASSIAKQVGRKTGAQALAAKLGGTKIEAAMLLSSHPTSTDTGAALCATAPEDAEVWVCLVSERS